MNDVKRTVLEFMLTDSKHFRFILTGSKGTRVCEIMGRRRRFQLISKHRSRSLQIYTSISSFYWGEFEYSFAIFLSRKPIRKQGKRAKLHTDGNPDHKELPASCSTSPLQINYNNHDMTKQQSDVYAHLIGIC